MEINLTPEKDPQGEETKTKMISLRRDTYTYRYIIVESESAPVAMIDECTSKVEESYIGWIFFHYTYLEFFLCREAPYSLP